MSIQEESNEMLNNSDYQNKPMSDQKENLLDKHHESQMARMDSEQIRVNMAEQIKQLEAEKEAEADKAAAPKGDDKEAPAAEKAAA